LSKYQVTILCEDKLHQQFVSRYLRNAGFGTHEIVRGDLPGGSGGAGDQWVHERYAAAVKEHRRRAAKGALVVVLDADTEETSRRTRQLDGLLRNAGPDPRGDGETIAHLIPRRNIETWILHLCGQNVDEVNDEKRPGVDKMFADAAATLFGWSGNPPADCLPSLRAAIQELKRLT
jgi:hypothetical protein